MRARSRHAGKDVQTGTELANLRCQYRGLETRMRVYVQTDRKTELACIPHRARQASHPQSLSIVGACGREAKTGSMHEKKLYPVKKKITNVRTHSPMYADTRPEPKRCISFGLSICRPLSAYFSTHTKTPPGFPPVLASIYLSIQLSISLYQSTYLSVYQFIYLLISTYLPRYIYLSSSTRSKKIGPRRSVTTLDVHTSTRGYIREGACL